MFLIMIVWPTWLRNCGIVLNVTRPVLAAGTVNSTSSNLFIVVVHIFLKIKVKRKKGRQPLNAAPPKANHNDEQ
jgi:hypothetical protein